jgi:prepilin-type processing-associated H-X9-DG protein
VLRHNGGFHLLFVDGHVKWTERTDWRMWAADPRVIPPSALRWCGDEP